MSMHPPPPDWFQRPHGAERLWVGLALAWWRRAGGQRPEGATGSSG